MDDAAIFGKHSSVKTKKLSGNNVSKREMKKSLVSCICVTYDRPQLLRELLYFFKAQTYPKKELVILNDQSNVIYECDDSEVRIYNYSFRFNSLGAKRNHAKGLISKSTKYVFWFDDDDVYYPNHITDLVSAQEELNVDVVKNKKNHFSINNKIEDRDNYNLFFAGSCFTKEYIINNDFDDNLSVGEDAAYIKNASVHVIDNEEATYHYRWGLNINHISAFGNEKGWSLSKADASDEKIYDLAPEISSDVNEYYES